MFNSDAIKIAIDLGTSLISLLDKMIGKLGTIPTLITAITAGLSIKNVGVFKNIDGHLTTTFNKIQSISGGFNLATNQVNRFVDGFNRLNSQQNFGKRWDNFINGISSRNENVATYFQSLATQGAQARASIEGVYAAILDGNTRGIGNIKSIISTFNSLDATKQQAFASAVGQTNVQLGTFLTRNVGATASLSGYGTQLVLATAKTVGLRVATTALNVALTMGISLIVTSLIQAIDKWITTSEEAKQAAEEARQKAVESAKAYKEEADSLKDLQSRYAELFASTTDIASIKEELSSLQDEITDKYGEEADAIDLVNGKYSEQIKAIQDLKKAEAEQYIEENRGSYETAKEFLSHRYQVAENGEFAFDRNGDAIKIKDNGYWSDKTLENWRAAGIDNIVTDKEIFGGEDVRSLYINGTPEEVYETLKKMSSIYAEQEGHHSSRLKLLEDEAAALKTQIDENNTIINQHETLIDYLKETNELSNPPTLENFEFYKELDKVQELNEEYQNATTVTGKFKVITEFENVRAKLQELASDNTILQEIVEETFSNFSIGADTATSSLSALNDEFSEMLDEEFKNTSDNVDTLKDALQSLAEGKYLDHDTAWDIFDMDTDGIIKDIKSINGEYSLSADELIKLKDQIIKKQEEQLRVDIAEAKGAMIVAQTRLAAAKEELKLKEAQYALDIGAQNIFLQTYKDNIASIEDEISGYEQLIGKNRILIRELNSNLGNTVQITDTLTDNIDAIEDEIDELQKQADNILKAQEDKIDGIVDNLEKEKGILEDQKQEMEDQLDILKEQQSELENIIEDYETVADIVGDVIQNEIDSIEENRQGVEDYYDNMIDRIKTANEERQDSINLAEKLAALENANNNMVRTYKQGSGWVYAVDKEEATSAREDLLSAKREVEISRLEKEKEVAISSYDEQIKALEEYAEQWTKVQKDITDAENAALAEQILGAEWRAKIKAQDTAIINTYRSNYTSYKNQLSNLINGEITSLNKSIEAKESEIEAKEKQIDSWNDYKTQIQQAAEDIENSLNGYSDLINNIALDENSSYETRVANLQNFINNYSSLMGQISDKNVEIATTTALLNDLQTTVTNFSAANAIEAAVSSATQMANDLRNRLSAFFTGDVFDNGGVNTQTGFAWMDGTRSASEVTFNAADGKKLYDLIHNTANLSDLLADKIAGNLKLQAKNNYQPSNNTSTNNTYNSWQFSGDIISNSPEDFMRQMNDYLRNVSGISKVNN